MPNQTTTSITTTYAGEFAGKYVAAALLPAPTIANNLITVKQNVKYKEVLKRVGLNDIVKDGSCDFDPTSTLTLTERILEPKDLQILCVKRIFVLTGKQSKWVTLHSIIYLKTLLIS